MGYQALLFCPDEKLARVVSQIFNELEFVVDPVPDRDTALEKLKTRHYDAVVADCENEEISALLLKSAHGSTSNQGSLAIAVVEGQAGVAKAYRIGANLVLTKPINVEQAKGTLRVARGLLRKNADSAAASSAASATQAAWPTPVGRGLSIEVTNRNAAATPAAIRSQPPDFDASLLAMEALQKIEEKIAPAAAAPKQAPGSAPGSAATSLFSAAEAMTAAKPPAATSAAAPVLNIASRSQGTAAAPAAAREAIAPPAKKPVEEKQEWGTIESSTPPQAGFSPTTTSDAPTFAALGEKSGGSDNSKKILIAAAILALAAAGYFGWTKFGETRSTPAPQPAPAPQKTAEPVQEIRPMSAPAPAPATGAVNRASAVTNTPATRDPSTPTREISEGDSAVPKIGLRTENESKGTAPAPLLVKQGAPAVKPQPQPEEPAAPAPGSLAVASNMDNGLNNLLSTATTGVAKPTLVRIKVSQGVSQGLVIKRVQPKYPANALSAHIQGAVEIEATVDKEGNVINPKVLRGDPTLAAAALTAVRQWRYKPYYLDGEPVEIQTQITVNFKTN